MHKLTYSMQFKKNYKGMLQRKSCSYVTLKNWSKRLKNLQLLIQKVLIKVFNLILISKYLKKINLSKKKLVTYLHVLGLKTLSSNYDCLYIHEKSELAAKVSAAAAIDLADAVYSGQFR